MRSNARLLIFQVVAVLILISPRLALATGQDTLPANVKASVIRIVEMWNQAKNSHDSEMVNEVYAESVMYYGVKMLKGSVVHDAVDFNNHNNSFSQKIIGDIRLSKIESGGYLAEFTKSCRFNGKVTNYEAYLVIANAYSENSYHVFAESDKLTDKNLARRKVKHDFDNNKQHDEVIPTIVDGNSVPVPNLSIYPIKKVSLNEHNASNKNLIDNNVNQSPASMPEQGPNVEVVESLGTNAFNDIFKAHPVVMNIAAVLALLGSIVFVGVFASWDEKIKQNKSYIGSEDQGFYINRAGGNSRIRTKYDSSYDEEGESSGSFGIKIISVICLMAIISFAAASIHAFLAIPGMTIVVLGVVMVLRRMFR
jgi:hypothetical protein